jgi:soluble lytic murein transglycosylase-like protein
MKKIPLLCALFAFASLHASAQTSYRFDNFDLSDGVRVARPEVPKAVRPSKKLKRLTARHVSATKPAAARHAEAPTTAALNPSHAPAGSLDGFSTGDAQVDSMIVESGRRHGVDPVLIYAIMHRESAFKKRALSHKGASGLMQLMPATARRFGVRNIWDPRENINAGARYMRFLLDTFGGDVRLALAGYNAGEGAVMKYGYRVPPYSETQEYVRRITQRYALMRDPETARRAPSISRAQVARISATEQPQFSGALYERNVYAVRTPEGKLRLVSQ